MRGNVTIKVLEAIGNATLGIADVFAVFSTTRYGASRSEFFRNLSKREQDRAQKEHERRLYVQYYNLLYKLKRDGLIKEEGHRGAKKPVLTQRGKDKLLFLKAKIRTALPEHSYAKEDADTVTIVSFDIPEKEKRKRSWLRGALRNMGFHMVQKSFWIGKVKVPKQFLENLRELKLLDCVEIFSVSKTGSLRHIA